MISDFIIKQVEQELDWWDKNGTATIDPEHVRLLLKHYKATSDSQLKEGKGE